MASYPKSIISSPIKTLYSAPVQFFLHSSLETTYSYIHSHFKHINTPIVPSIYLPDTIMFSFDIPEVWYFGNQKGVRRKLKINVTLENIEKAFSKDVSKHGIVAQYIALSPDPKTTPLTFTYIHKDELSNIRLFTIF